ncbi:MAG: type II toxin-antitoxin system VapC family toxin [Bacteroidota bacterium]
MEPQYLIDSNSLIDYLVGKLPPKGMDFMNKVINIIPVISVITKIEVLGYKTVPGAYKLLQDFVDDSIVISLSDDVVQQTIDLREIKKIKIPDAIIVSHLRCRLLSANYRLF